MFARVQDMRPCPGVRIEDMGHKMGCNGVDNGKLWFDSAWKELSLSSQFHCTPLLVLNLLHPGDPEQNLSLFLFMCGQRKCARHHLRWLRQGSLPFCELPVDP